MTDSTRKYTTYYKVNTQIYPMSTSVRNHSNINTDIKMKEGILRFA